jgi:hypothetical protein
MTSFNCKAISVYYKRAKENPLNEEKFSLKSFETGLITGTKMFD